MTTTSNYRYRARQILSNNRQQTSEPSTSFYKTLVVFLWSLSVVYVIAFLSFLIQYPGLIGVEGILPISFYLSEIERHYPFWSRIWLYPTLSWISAADHLISLQCYLGIVSSLAALNHKLRTTALTVCWILYLSLSVAGQEFASFQWDNLLLESGSLAIFLSFQLKRQNNPGIVVARLLLHWLLFRLMFSSGLVKLMSQDQTWSQLTALTFHYETQPLPNLVGYYLHHAPLVFHKFSAAIMFFIELIAPFFIFAPRPLRILSFLLLSTLQILIASSGNFAFFNLLTFILCITLLDDNAWPICKFNDKVLVNPAERQIATTINQLTRHILSSPFVLLVLFVTTIQISTLVLGPKSIPERLVTTTRFVSPFRSINTYGLFAIMTTERFEIVIEGSNDQQNWEPYEFLWKPQALHQAPRQIAPYHPRLDWQMWFAALSPVQENPWFLNFTQRLLTGSKAVDSLLAVNPFPDSPPLYIRALLYRYSFTNLFDKDVHGRYWKRQLMGFYLPEIALDSRVKQTNNRL